MLKIEIKNRHGAVLFSHKCDNNVILITLLQAIKSGADLSGADLSGADLSGADLSGAYLSGADLSGADLRCADLRCAYLSGADLSGADLSGADLSGAYLSGADLSGAYLSGADLRCADLSGAYLSGADLSVYKIKTAIVFTGLYEYTVIPFITEEKEKRLIMGSFNRSLDEWKSDFWNNDNEFPNNGSLKSNLRLMAYNTALAWFDLIDK